MENIIKVEFTVKMDKSIYEASPWKTREEFLYYVILNHMDADLGIHKMFAEKMEGPKKENYEIFIKSLEEMKDSVNKSIQHEVINVSGNIEEVKVSFSFKYYETPTVTAERTVEGFIFVTPLDEVTRAIEDIERAKKIPGKVPDDKKEQVEKAILMFKHAINFIEEAKSSLIVTKNGVDLGNIFEAPKTKLKM